MYTIKALLTLYDILWLSLLFYVLVRGFSPKIEFSRHLPYLYPYSLLIISPFLRFLRVNKPKKEQSREWAVLSCYLVYGLEEWDTQQQRVSSPLLFSGLWTAGGGPSSWEWTVLSCSLIYGLEEGVTQEQRLSSPLLFPDLWTGGRRGWPRSRDWAVLSCSLVYGLEKGDPGAESEQSSLVLWSMDWRRGTQKPGTGLECQACCMTASSVGWLFLLLYGQHGLIACPRAAAAACIACVATRLGFLTF
jgi:hypothetical protein